MAQIHVLDSETIDKIAAGEVVERPSSVVKELVENAIDAGATAVTVEAKDGGISFIRVTDNGSGMERDQIRKAFLRHATSKIEQADDLMRVNSLGFRGEALSSIAAVSQVEVITKTADSLTGVRILLEGAVEKGFEEVGVPDGTTFIMRNLFFNTPVRRKFLKQPATEGGYIADLMEHLALSRPDISFKLILGSQTKFHTSGNGDLREVIYRIYGRDIANALVPIQEVADGIHIEGYLGKPILVRSNRNFEIYYINGRFIKSSLVARAVEEGYKEYLMQHKFPLCVLHITMDRESVDVNVHPTKMDVRFSDSIRFANLIAEVVRRTLKNQEMIPGNVLEDEKEHKRQIREEQKAVQSRKTPEVFERQRTDSYRVMEESSYRAERPKKQDFLHKPVWNRVFNQPDEEKDAVLTENIAKTDEETFFVEENAQKRGKTQDIEDGIQDVENEEMTRMSEMECDVRTVEIETTPQRVEDQETTGIFDRQKVQLKEHTRTMDAPAVVEPEQKSAQMNFFEERLLSAENRSRYQIIGQVFDTYWLVQFEDKLFIIDQHAAHEKVKYERMMKQFHEKNVVSQTLLPPIIVSLTGQEETVLKQYRDVFAAIGFEIEEFGGSEYALRSVPVDLYGCSEKELFLEVLDELSEGLNRSSFQVVEEKIASMSCKAAVKGNNRLSRAEAEELIDELLTLENPYNCPHGRPTIISMTKYELERKFKRVVN